MADRKVKRTRELWAAGLLAHVEESLSTEQCRELAGIMFESAGRDAERGFHAHAKISEAYGEFLTAEADRKVEEAASPLPGGSRAGPLHVESVERPSRCRSSDAAVGVVVGGRYDLGRDVVVAELEGGAEVSFPPRLAPGLTEADPSAIANVEASPGGLHWPDLDEDLSLAGILDGRFGRDPVA